MRREDGVEDWLPGGIALRAPAVADVSSADFVAGRPRGTTGLSDADHASTDLNEVGFEELIELGISVAQAARLISQRERRGGLTDVAEVDDLHGLEPGVRDILRWSGRVK